jgi:hypothetical protein
MRPSIFQMRVPHPYFISYFSTQTQSPKFQCCAKAESNLVQQLWFLEKILSASLSDKTPYVSLIFFLWVNPRLRLCSLATADPRSPV